MATSLDPIFVDTNVLIYAKLTLSQFHPSAAASLQKQAAAGARIWISRQVLLFRSGGFRP